MSVGNNVFNFYEELEKSLKNEDDCRTNNENLCLITHNPLEENYIKLECGHNFNYDAIYIDVYNHKKKYNLQEVVRLKNNQIRCPYCRNIQNSILPHYEGKTVCYGVNTLNSETNVLYCSKILTCGKNKNQQCKNNCFKDSLCKRHYNMSIKNLSKLGSSSAIVENNSAAIA